VTGPVRMMVAALLALAPACARAAGPVEVPARDVPFPLSRSPEAGGVGQAESFRVFFVRGERLAPVERRISSDIPPQRAAVEALLAGPTMEEQAQQIRSDIPRETRLLGMQVVDRVAVVDLSGEFQAPSNPDAILLRTAQVVWTLSQFPGVNAVRFQVDGDTVAVIVDGGNAVERPVSTPDYAAEVPSYATSP
jgi:hypothetical protein